jgi:hypothetical protein
MEIRVYTTKQASDPNALESMPCRMTLRAPVDKDWDLSRLSSTHDDGIYINSGSHGSEFRSVTLPIVQDSGITVVVETYRALKEMNLYCAVHAANPEYTPFAWMTITFVNFDTNGRMLEVTSRIYPLPNQQFFLDLIPTETSPLPNSYT